MKRTGSANRIYKSTPNPNNRMKHKDPVNENDESTTNLRNNNSRNKFNSITRRNPENRIRNSDLYEYSRTVNGNIVYTLNRS